MHPHSGKCISRKCYHRLEIFARTVVSGPGKIHYINLNQIEMLESMQCLIPSDFWTFALYAFRLRIVYRRTETTTHGLESPSSVRLYQAFYSLSLWCPMAFLRITVLVADFAGESVLVEDEVVVINSIVLPNKTLNQSVQDEIILWRGFWLLAKKLVYDLIVTN